MKQRTRKVWPNTVEVTLGDALEWGIQRWVVWSGREAKIAEEPWLEGPVGSKYIGAEFYRGYAREADLDAVTDDEDAGLLPSFDALAGEQFDSSLVHPEIRDFYERTARYDLCAQIGWSGPFKHPPRTLIHLVGHNVGQFDIPLSAPAIAMKNELINLKDRTTDVTSYVGWFRRSAATGEAMLAGLYTTCELPATCGRFFKGVYPLPGGSATTIFRPENRPDGSFALVSDGRRFGEAGYYRIHRTDDGALRVKRVPMEETIHVFVDAEGALHARHTFVFCRAHFLHLDYEITPRERRVTRALTRLQAVVRLHEYPLERKSMTLNEALLKRLIETPGVSGREERQREIAREELGSLTDEVLTDALGSVIGTKQGSDEARVMVAAHTDEIGYLVKHIDDKGFIRLQTLGGHDPANMVSQSVLVTTSDGETLRGALQPSRKPPHLSRGEEQKPPKADEFYVDLGMDAETVKEKVRVGDYVVMDRTLEKVGENYFGKAMDDRIGVFVMYEALRAMGDHQATIFAAATSQEEVGVRGAEASGSALEPTVVVALDVTLAMDVPGGGNENTITELGKGVAIKIMDSHSISHPKLVDHLRTIAEREDIPYQMEILPSGGTDAAGVQRLHGGIPAVTLSIPCRYVHTPNEMVNASDVEAAITLLARYLEEASDDDYAL